MDTTDKYLYEITNILKEKGIQAGDYCTFKRQYGKDKLMYCVGRLRVVNKLMILTDTEDFVTAYRPNWRTLWKNPNIKINTDNVQYITISTWEEKSSYKIIRDC